MRAVNLLPLEARAGRRRPPAAALALAGAGLVAASVLVVGFVSANGKVDSRERELSRLEQELAATRRAAKPEPAKTGVSAERDQRFTALSGALAERLAWDRVLREVSLVLPNDVWLSSLAVGESGAEGEAGATPGQAGRTLTFNGYTYSQESVARLMTRLGLANDLGEVRLQQSTVTSVGSQQIYNFIILADVISGGGNP